MSKEKEAKGQRSSGKAAAPPAEGDIAWRKFPTLEKVLGSDQLPPMLRSIEETCRQLDEVMRSGSPEEKKRGKAAMAAYGRTLELLRELSGRRDRAAQS